MKNIFAVVTAAGSGSRLGYSQPKALVCLNGISLVERAVKTFTQHPQVAGVVVTAPADREIFSQFEKIFEGAPQVLVVKGGPSRQASVYQGLLGIEKLAEKLAITKVIPQAKVLIHDAARCLMPTEVIDRISDKLEEVNAVIPVLPVVDTLTKVVNQTGEWAGETPDRSTLRAVQTPQGFKYQTILRAHQKAQANQTGEFTDDASLMQLVNEPVALVAGSEFSLKITTPFDLEIARSLVTLNPSSG
ncbi:2-C-methyl-D-erythritol 4-phosphate cytidylyltransferase [Gleimia sp. 6138-11-ORH1]|uniref:2-C-methyl-D-erythritol 4-phosphate cytidylyltransferase n=1 Tax=Gleimia sp. 6138-11-ORH1 TaxID=2973937 RepID=UPI00216A185C|nr:2-C-methyl-D-erythritol 4-phosphate cytidylyltransferase [Gleimia sp. 6138-11-ORH1]MCS4485031.1 2-C-methyl-D-erythritol 4-phosphate cytidylyltransferase [Gleimia sp. 6138-11-ORH1]